MRERVYNPVHNVSKSQLSVLIQMIFINTICASGKYFETGCPPKADRQISSRKKNIKGERKNIIEINKSFLNKILNI